MNIINTLRDEKFIEEFSKDCIEQGKSSKYVINAIVVLSKFDKNHKWEIPRKASIPKEDGSYREVFIFSEKDSIILKAINKALGNKYSNLISKRVYSYKVGVNSKMAIESVSENLKENSSYIKTDISKYFNTVCKDAIFKALDRLFKDKDSNTLMKR